MSIWISEFAQAQALVVRAWSMAAILLLSACFGPDGGALGFLASGNERKQAVSRDVLRSVELYDGDVVVRGPRGYCIDRKALRRTRSMAFVLLASCESLSGVRGNEVEPVIMTLSVLPDQPDVAKPSAAEIAQSMAGVEVLKQVERRDITLVHFSSGGDTALPGGDPRHWRGGMVLNGHLIGLALYSRQGSPKAGRDGHALLTELAQALRRSSP